MLDPKLLRNELDFVAERLALRNMTLDTAAIRALEEKRRNLQTETEKLQSERRNARNRPLEWSALARRSEAASPGWRTPSPLSSMNTSAVT